MTLTRICKTFRFEAAHQLPNHDGKCARPHGHSYRVDVTLIGELHTDGPKEGMVIDFGDVADVWNNELQPLLDHRNLNDTIDIAPTTAELIARWAYARLRGTLGGVVERVRVYETSNSWAEFPA